MNFIKQKTGKPSWLCRTDMYIGVISLESDGKFLAIDTRGFMKNTDRFDSFEEAKQHLKKRLL